MTIIKGKYNSAKVFAEVMDDTAREQIQTICDLEFLSNCKIRIMPDVHAGVGCTIGTTLTISDAVIPNMVGVDIGCGMLVAELSDRELNLPMLDEVIRNYIPSGREVHDANIADFEPLNSMRCLRALVRPARLIRSLGTLGGGNHFIEVNVDDDGKLYLVIHSGSRNLGKQVAEYYQQTAYDDLKGMGTLQQLRKKVIAACKKEGRQQQINDELKKAIQCYAQATPKLPFQLAYLTGEHLNDYLFDMRVSQQFATLNRQTMLNVIVEQMNLRVRRQFTTVHNYINMQEKMLRKGAVSAHEGEQLLIPMNMRDGSLICIGKGNTDWNCSAPHGAGRLLGRAAAKARIALESYENSMRGIFTTSVNKGTLDEAPDAYKPMESIVRQITPTVQVIKAIKPIYNFKASD